MERQEKPGENGQFRLSGLPEGAYQVDVWHPEFEPEQRRHEIRIDAHRTREVFIRFKPPKWLTDPPPLPATPVKQWALLGPFEHGRKIYPPEQKLNWRAVERTTYKYKQVSPLRWRVSDGRLGHYAATGFFYTELYSPRAQQARRDTPVSPAPRSIPRSDVSIPSNPRKALTYVLDKTMVDPDELRILIGDHIPEIVTSVNWHASMTMVVNSVADQLMRRGLSGDTGLWNALRQHAPGHRDMIDAAESICAT